MKTAMPPSGPVVGLGGTELFIEFATDLLIPLGPGGGAISEIDVSTCQFLTVWLDLTFGSLVDYNLTYLLRSDEAISWFPSFYGYDTTPDRWVFVNGLLRGEYQLVKATVGTTVKAMFVIPTHGINKIALGHQGTSVNTSSKVTIRVSRNWGNFPNYQQEITI